MAKSPTNLEPNESEKKKQRITLYIPEDLMTDIQLISVLSDKSLSDIGEITLTDFVKKWVKEHGPLPKKP